MADRLMERAGDLASQLGSLALRSLKVAGRAATHAHVAALARQAEHVAARQADVAQQTAVRKAEDADIRSAQHRFESLMEVALASYVPSITQADVNDVTWTVPGGVAALLEREMSRIIDILTPIMRSAEFPLGSTDAISKERMTEVWMKARRQMQLKAFGQLRLPPYFGLYDGLIGYEPVVLRDGAHSPLGWFGQWTGFRYQSRPALLG